MLGDNIDEVGWPASGEIDMLSRNTTWTLSRDTEWGATFAPTTFYDGQGIGTRAELGVTSLAELDGGSVCVQQGTTTELNIADAITSRGLDITVDASSSLTDAQRDNLIIQFVKESRPLRRSRSFR